MENGQVKDLNLDAPLDVKSSDMLVSINDEKFAHNRQRWQGHVLPTSLRYEHNGWAAGWHVYEFEFDEGYISDKDIALTRVNFNSNPSYVVKLRTFIDGKLGDDLMPTFKYNPRSYAWSRDVTNLTYISASNSLTTSLHFTFDDYTMTVDVKSPTGWADEGEFVATSSIEPVITAIDKSTLNSDGRIKLTVTNTDKIVNINGKVTLPSAIYSDPMIADDVSILPSDILQTYSFAEFVSHGDSISNYESTVFNCGCNDSILSITAKNNEEQYTLTFDENIGAFTRLFNIVSDTQIKSNKYNCVLKNVSSSNSTNNLIHSKAKSNIITNMFNIEGSGGYCTINSDKEKNSTATVSFDIRLISCMKVDNTVLASYSSQIASASHIGQGSVGWLTLYRATVNTRIYWMNRTVENVTDGHRTLETAGLNAQRNGYFTDDIEYIVKLRMMKQRPGLVSLDSLDIAATKVLAWLYDGRGGVPEEITKSSNYYLYAYIAAYMRLSNLYIRSRRIYSPNSDYNSYFPETGLLAIYLPAQFTNSAPTLPAMSIDISRMSAEQMAYIIRLASLTAYELSNYILVDFHYADGTQIARTIIPADSPSSITGSHTTINWDTYGMGQDYDYISNWSEKAADTTTHIYLEENEYDSGDFDYGWGYRWGFDHADNPIARNTVVGSVSKDVYPGIAITPKYTAAERIAAGDTDKVPALLNNGIPAATGSDVYKYGDILMLSAAGCSVTSISGNLLVGNSGSSTWYQYVNGNYSYLSWPYLAHNSYSINLSNNLDNIKDKFVSSSVVFEPIKNTDKSTNYVYYTMPLFNIEVNGVTYEYNDVLSGSVSFNAYIVSKTSTTDLRCPEYLYYIANTANTSSYALPYAIGDNKLNSYTTYLGNMTSISIPASVTGGNVTSISQGYSLTLAIQCDFESAFVVGDATTSLSNYDYITDHWFYDVVLPNLLVQKRSSNNHKLEISNNLHWGIDTDKVADEYVMLNYIFNVMTLDDIADNSPTHNTEINLKYNVATGDIKLMHNDTELIGDVSIYYDSSKSYFTFNVSGDYNKDTTTFRLIFKYNIPYKLYYIPLVLESTDWKITSLRENILRITNGYNYVDMNITSAVSTLFYRQPSGIYLELPITNYSSLIVGDITYKEAYVTTYQFNFDRAVDASIYLVPKAVYNITGTIYSFDYSEEGNGLYWNMNYNGTDYRFKVSDLDNVNTYLDLYSTDVRESVDDRKHIERIDCSKEKQLLKQFWDTDVTTENFWWIDSQTVLQLTDDSFILYTKLGTKYDPWNGDNWEVLQTFKRTDYITSAVKRYFCTSAYGDSAIARFCTLEALSNDLLRIKIYNPKNNMDVTTYDIQILTSALGSSLVQKYYGVDTAYICSYTDILVPAFLSEVKISSTIVDGYMILGLHYDNNLNQWAIWLDTDKTSKSNYTITGYGYVGPSGDLTGGEIPVKYFDYTKGGFIGTVNDLSVLNTTKTKALVLGQINSITEQIVGNESQQWYISTTIDSIVSHLTLTTDHRGFKVRSIPITNNYSMSYESPSFVVRRSGDIGIGAKSLSSLFPGITSEYESLWNVILMAIGYPLIYYMNPRISTINYLQQTLGQYAMVHYNSTISHPAGEVKDIALSYMTKDDKNVLVDDLSFDIVTVPQEQSVGDAPWSVLFYALGASAVNALEYNLEKVVVNTHQNQTSTSDTGMRFSQMFLKNLESMTSTEFMVQSLTPTIKSEVTALKTLDMFYSTSNSQHVQAGPGFVVHNFVQQCIAQSVTSVQLESQQLAMTYIIKALTLYQLKLEQKILKAMMEVIYNQADYQGGTPFTIIGLSSGTSFGWLISVLLSTVYSTMQIINSAIEISIESIDPLLDSIGAKELKTTVTAKQSKHVYDIEAKHRYGSKHEVFMWPCFGCTAKQYKDETVVATTESKPWHISISPFASGQIHLGLTDSLADSKPATNTIAPSSSIKDSCVGDIDYRIAACYGQSSVRTLPDDMNIIVGVDSFMPATTFKNENISESEPVFTPPVIHDFVISKEFELFESCVDGDVLWVGCRDTKLIDGEPSNIVFSNGFCGVASSYTAIEIRNGIQREYIRPWAVTPEVLAFNQTGINVAFDEQAYHGFDGVSYRITDWYGAAGMNKEFFTQQYAFQPNDRLKRSNKLPANNFLGNFMFDPSMDIDVHDSVCSIVTVPAQNKGLESGVVGEDKDDLRYALPIFSEFVSTLPAVVKTAQPYKLAIFDGITSLTTAIRNTQTAYKTPVSDDFILGDQLYRATHEYICRVDEQDGVIIVTPILPNLGMTYLGASPYEAWFYSQATRQYYSYTGGTSIKLVDMLERFRNIRSGRWDFINQEVIFPCLATMSRVDKYVADDADETDNIIIPAIRNGIARGEVTPPERTLFDTDSWFRTLSLSSGLVYQGPNRCAIQRFTYCDYMLVDIKNNKRKWARVPREQYHPFREYPENYKDVTDYIDNGVRGWTHNPFLLVTAPLGVNEETDCLFEWEITFAWTVEMERIIDDNEYITVNVMAETMTPGGKVFNRPTHIYLTKDLFTRSDNYGYYSFRYEGNNGIGNRERLHIWSDGYIAISSLQIEYKIMTSRRNTILTQHVDIQGKQEM